MTKLNTNTMLSALVIFTLCSYVTPQNLDEHEAWFGNLANAKQKVARIRFYVQDVIAGGNATVWEVARANITHTSPSTFGQVVVMDDLITATPDPNSMKLGRGQGILTSMDLQVPALGMNINYFFTAGEYNGSSITIVGRNQILNGVRELPIVGGTGLFRMARGYSISRTMSFDPVKNHGVIEHNLFIAYLE